MIATIVKLSWGKSYRSCGNHRPQVKYRKRVMMCFFMTSRDSKWNAQEEVVKREGKLL